MAYTQDQRPIGIDTPLGKDRLLLTAISGEEAISKAFTLRLELLSVDHALKPEDIVGKRVTVRIGPADGEKRHINGFISRFWMEWTTLGGLRVCGAEMVPWFWFLSQTSDCRIFQKKSVKTIAEDIFVSHKFSDFDMSGLKENHPEWTCSVQYQESASAYLSRLMEGEGVFYFFRHDRDKHTMVLADTNQVFSDTVESELAYNPAGVDEDRITAWKHDFRFHAGGWSTSDYNYKNPDVALRSDRKLFAAVDNMADFEHFEWPGGYFSRESAESLVRHRIEEVEAGFHLVEGRSTCAAFAPGARFRVAEHPDPHHARTHYVLVSVRHEARDNSYVSGDANDYAYANTFTAFPLHSCVAGTALPYRPARVTPKPVIQSAQTAVVVGPPGETIYCDEFARVKVQFHWDRHGARDHTSSPWVRVSQAWAGKGYGTLHLPHVGQEVIVSFLDGDPDRPVITGRVYNGREKDPLLSEALEYKTRSITKDQGGNVIATEGKAGGQRILLSSPTATSSIQIGAIDGVLPSAGAATDAPPGITMMTGANLDIQVKQDATTKVAGNATVDVTGDYVLLNDTWTKVTTGNSYSATQGDSYKYTNGTSQTTTYGGSLSWMYGNTYKYTASTDGAISFSASYAISIGAKATVNVGVSSDIKLSAAMSFVIGQYDLAINSTKGNANKTEVNLLQWEASLQSRKTAASKDEASALTNKITALEIEVFGMAMSDAAVMKKESAPLAVKNINLDIDFNDISLTG